MAVRRTQAPATRPTTARKSISGAVKKLKQKQRRQQPKLKINLVIFLRGKLINERFMDVPAPQFNSLMKLKAKHRELYPEEYIMPPPTESEHSDSDDTSANDTRAATPEPEIKIKIESSPEIKIKIEEEEEEETRLSRYLPTLALEPRKLPCYFNYGAMLDTDEREGEGMVMSALQYEGLEALRRRFEERFANFA